MLTKLATFRGISSAGEPLVQLFHPGTSLTKLSGSVMPEVQQWLANYKADQNKIALLVNALGASEYWGQNINGDIFPEAALVHDCRKHPSDMHPVDDLTGRTIPAYGYPTFLQAYPYVHHRNKDPSRAFGNVVVSCWNPKMHRVELVVVLDRSLALQHGASGVVDRIDAGEYPDVSMGCKVPWDQCTICNHRSKTREDYCSCVKNIGLGRILDDGRRIGVINTYPRFFDISFVFIGADKTAKVMSKLGSSMWLPQSIVDADAVYDVRALCGAQDCKECAGCKVKAASVKRAESAETNDADPENMMIDRGKMTKPEPKPKLEIPVEQLIFSRRDWQGERAGNGDGALSTNMNSYANEDPWEKTSTDIIAGGKASNKPDSDFSKKQLEMGRKVELEHTVTPKSKGNPSLANEIAKDHLEEFPDYYTRLNKMESEAKKEAAINPIEAYVTRAKNLPAPNMWLPTLLGTGSGAATGAAVGGLSAPEGQRAQGALIGGAGGALLGTGAGALAGVGRRMALTDVQKELSNLQRRAATVKPLRLRPSAATVRSKKEVARLATRVEKARAMRDAAINRGDQSSFAHHKATVEDLKALRQRALKVVKERSAKDVAKAQAPMEQMKGLKQEAIRTLKGAKDYSGGFPVSAPAVGTLAGTASGLVGSMLPEKRSASPVSEMFEQAKALKVGPPPQPNRKELPFSGSINFRGIGINVENVPGSWRTGKGWKTLMRLPYGEFAKTKGMDGDKLDVYVGPYQDAANVYVVHQNVPQTGKYDEDKVMLGFHTPEQAKAAYFAHYNDPRFFRSLTTMSFSLFKRALLGGEMDGEKVASISSLLVKTAEEFRLEDLFEDRPGRIYRERSWVDKATGEKKHKRSSGMNKTASAGLSASELLKLSDQQKWADIVKEIGPDKAVGRVSPALSAAEPTMDRAMLDTMGRCGIESALATPSLLGMVLKPEEFQRLALGHMQLPNVADEFERDHVTFDPTTSKDELPLCKELDESQASDSLLSRLKDLIESRSYLGPVVRRRMIRIMVAKPGEAPQTSSSDTGPVVEKHAGKANSLLLSKLASAYNWYRREQIKVALAAPEFLAKKAELRAKVLGLDDADIFSTKTAEIGGLSKGQLAMVLGSVPLTLMYSSHLRDQERVGRQLGFLESMVAGNPWITSVGVAGVLRELLKSPQAKRVMQAAVEKVS